MKIDLCLRQAFCCIALFCVLPTGIVSAQATADPPKAKNIFLFIGDGMGFNNDLAATYYRYGEAKKQRYHSFPVHLGCTTFSRLRKNQAIPQDVRGYDPGLFWESPANATLGTAYTQTTDSAASGTALASGTKTLNAKIGMSPDDEPVELISEIAVKLGKKAGTVTSVPLSHATPACFGAHAPARGRMDLIFRQMVSPTSPLSVVMGSGHPLYGLGKPIKAKADEKESDRKKRFLAAGGEECWKDLSAKGSRNGYTLIETREQFEKLAGGAGTVPDRVVGIVRTNKDAPPTGGDLEDMPETKELLKKQYAGTNWDEIPPLETMMRGAISVLTKDNDNGFFLMVEGGAIDHANHAQNINRSVLEHTAFAKAIDAAIDWVEKNSSWDETLMIITADHETGQLWGAGTFDDDSENDVFDEGDTFNAFMPVENKGRGKVPGVQFAGKRHSNSLVPIWAKGPGAERFLDRARFVDKRAGEFWKFSGRYVDNIDVFHVMKAALAP